MNSIRELSIENRKLIKRINKTKLPKDISYFSERLKFFNNRNEFLWKWSYSLMSCEDFIFSSVEKKYFALLAKTKTLLIMFITLLDDTADKFKDKKMLDKLSKIPFENDIKNSDSYINLVFDIWKNIYEKISRLQRFKEFKEMFMFDLMLLINAFYYSILINKQSQMLNVLENKIYSSHNMGMFLYADIDLMASPSFNKKELGAMRTIIWHAQQMARIGNWVSTWKRELNENDISSGVIAYALKKRIITLSDLNRDRNEIIKKIENSDMKDYFLNEWKRHYHNIQNLGIKVKSIDIKRYLKGLEMVLKYHLASEGLK